MTETRQSASSHVLDESAASVRIALADLDRHEAALGVGLGNPAQDGERWVATIGRVEGSLDEWQNMLGHLVERAQSAFDDLAGMDAELRRSLGAVAVARKYLQATGSRAADD